MNEHRTLVVTSISEPNWILEALANGCRENDLEFILIGDEASPKGFQLDGCAYYGLDDQYKTDLRYARLCPTRSYARKNIGYLIAMSNGATDIIETDDDNIPYDEFWRPEDRHQTVATVAESDWVNVYRFFTDANIWPRGLPLEKVRSDLPAFESLSVRTVDCPIQQGLVNENPDTDAIYRLVDVLPQSFCAERRVALTNGAWCPFNSQNTRWWPDAFPLLYLPASCTMRMTDIWRSFVAQRIAWTNDWGILFRAPTAWQERNEHDLLKDFRDEIPGYLNNANICRALAALPLKPGMEHLAGNLRTCYEKLVGEGWVGAEEIELLEAWIKDLVTLNVIRHN